MKATAEAVDTTLDDVAAAYRKRDEMIARLNDQNQYLGSVVRAARAAGHTWAAIAEHAGTSDVAVLKAARRPELVKAS